MSEAFTITGRIGDAAAVIDDDGRRELFYAICMYGCYGVEPELPSNLMALFISLKNDIDASIRMKARQKKKSGPKRKQLSDKHRFMILERDGFTCQYCGAKAPDAQLEVDHIFPFSKGGDDSPENYVTACHNCNSGKRAHVLGTPRKWK